MIVRFECVSERELCDDGGATEKGEIQWRQIIQIQLSACGKRSPQKTPSIPVRSMLFVVCLTMLFHSQLCISDAISILRTLFLPLRAAIRCDYTHRTQPDTDSFPHTQRQSHWLHQMIAFERLLLFSIRRNLMKWLSEWSGIGLVSLVCLCVCVCASVSNAVYLI